ncbi:MAG: dehydratase [Chloroflexi bacterium HGW-Chloroflexi-1]|nr:MAG: dehydratase [Chloroflexi bacterium HGW-Chloroflexi-1]
MADLAIQHGLYFEEFAVGDSVTSSGRTITEADIVAFAALSGDWNAIHVDAEYAAKGMFGERIAHGLLGLSVASGLAVQLRFMEGTVIAFMGLDWKFRAAIKIGDTIRVHAEVAELKLVPRLGGGIVTFDVQVLNQRDEVTQRGTWSMLVKSKATG